MSARYKQLFISVAAILIVGFCSIVFAPSSQAMGWYFGLSQGYHHGGYYAGGYDDDYPRPYHGSVIINSDPWRWVNSRTIYNGCRVTELRRYCRSDDYGYTQCYVQRVEGWRC